MHELTVAESILEIVTNAAQKRRITGISLVIGEFTSISPDSLKFCFDLISRGTIAEGAVLSLTGVETAFRCKHCSFEFGLDSSGVCPCCGQNSGEMVRGREFYVESIDVDE